MVVVFQFSVGGYYSQVQLNSYDMDSNAWYPGASNIPHASNSRRAYRHFANNIILRRGTHAVERR